MDLEMTHPSTRPPTLPSWCVLIMQHFSQIRLMAKSSDKCLVHTAGPGTKRNTRPRPAAKTWLEAMGSAGGAVTAFKTSL